MAPPSPKAQPRPLGLNTALTRRTFASTPGISIRSQSRHRQWCSSGRCEAHRLFSIGRHCARRQSSRCSRRKNRYRATHLQRGVDEPSRSFRHPRWREERPYCLRPSRGFDRERKLRAARRVIPQFGAPTRRACACTAGRQKQVTKRLSRRQDSRRLPIADCQLPIADCVYFGRSIRSWN